MRKRIWPLLLCCLALQALLAADFVVQLSEKVLVSAEKKFGAPARERLTAWTRLMADNKKKTEPEKLKLVNDFFNRVPFESDIDHWNLQDYWATPTEMLATNGGDCEDYAIAKYFTLLALGVNMDKMRINYVKARNLPTAEQAHMVLTYYAKPDAIPLVLDNLIPDIKSAADRADLLPVYSFNGEGLWLAKERGSGRVEGGSSKISLWNQLNARMGKEFE
jgi:predicted transglutaminase-like cysteine proteinase